jgi:Virulence factor membrane-bound polymerase, C-terminal/O-Antigen ligase/Protein glycosylation ligase
MLQGSLSSVALLLGALALLLSWLTPGHYFPWITFQHEAVAALGGLLLAAAALANPRGGMVWPRSAILVAALAAVPAVQYALGQIAFRSDALLSVLYLLGLACAIAVGASLAGQDRRRLLDIGFGVLLAAGIVSTGLALTQWTHIGPIGFVMWTPQGVRPFGNLGQPNHLAGLLAMSSLAALWFYETRRINGAALCTAVVWLALGMALTRSRMVLVAVAVVVVAWLLLRRRFDTRLKTAPLMAWVGLFALLNLLVGPLSGMFDVAAPQSMTERVQARGGRLYIWTALLDGLLQSPWVGYGWSQVSRAGLAGSLEHFTGESMLRNSHSLPLDLLLWNGIPMGLLILGAIAVWWVGQLRRCDSAERALTLAVVAVLSVYSLFEFPLEFLHFLVPFGLFVGALDNWSGSLKASRATYLASAAAFCVLVTFTILIWTEYLGVEQASRDGRMISAGYGVKAEFPEPFLLDEPLDYVRFWRTSARPGMTADELDWMRRVAGRNPAPPTLLRYATALGVNGRPDEAQRLLVRLCNMHAATRCDEGRQSWALLQQRFPVLGEVKYPATPTGP